MGGERVMRLGLAFVALIAMTSTARAWGKDGHEIVAGLAETYLAPKTRIEIDKFLAPGEHLAQIASWADEYRKSCANTGPWHYVNIPLAAAGYVPDRDCAEPRGCVISATDRELAILADPNAPAEDRSRALRLAVHFIADLHQPLHSGDRADRGGNDLRVRFAGRSLTLHGFWDFELLAWTGRKVGDYIAMLSRSLTPAEARRFKRGNVRDWVLEAQRTARRVYAKLPVAADPQQPIELSPDYAKRMLPILDEQLLRAGVRLAAALDRAFASPGPAATELQLTAARACGPPARQQRH
jgi:hypothetical protein